MDFCIGVSAGFLLGLVSVFVSVGRRRRGGDISIFVVGGAMSLLMANKAKPLLHVFGSLLVGECHETNFMTISSYQILSNLILSDY
jgi:hypothetical protein